MRICPRDLCLSRIQACMAAIKASRLMKSICSARMPKSRLRSAMEPRFGESAIGVTRLDGRVTTMKQCQKSNRGESDEQAPTSSRMWRRRWTRPQGGASRPLLLHACLALSEHLRILTSQRREEYGMRTAFGYVRVSSEEQADSGLGLEAQRQRVRAYCEMKGLDLENIFEDPGVSGGKPLGSRPAGSRLLAEARRTRPVVVVARLDRLFRSVADAAQTIADFDRLGIELVAISESFDMTNPYGRAMAQMASVFAELERAMIKERTRAAMKVKRGRGERISGHEPFGWDFGPDGLLIKNRREQRAITRIRELHGQGTSLRKIAQWLNDRGIKPKRGKRWIHSSVLRIVGRE